LECVEGLEGAAREVRPLFDFCLDWIAAMSHTKLGMNLYFSGWGGIIDEHEEYVSLLQVAVITGPPSGAVKFITSLGAAGLRQPVPLSILVYLVMYRGTVSDLKELLDYLAAPTVSSALLPTPDEFACHLRSNIPLWSFLLGEASASEIDAMVNLVGPPEIKSAKLLNRALPWRESNPAIFDMFKDIGTQLSPTMSSSVEFGASTSSGSLNFLAKRGAPKVSSQSFLMALGPT
jgi:hypothetical protein